jgi:uncharacterized protein YqeY
MRVRRNFERPEGKKSARLVVIAAEGKETENIYFEAGRLELAEKERKERVVLEEFVPKQLSYAEVEANVKEIITATGATSLKDMGKVMAQATQRMKGVADGKLISSIVRELLA